MTHKFRVNLEVDWEHQKICLQEPLSGFIRWKLQFPDLSF